MVITSLMVVDPSMPMANVPSNATSFLVVDPQTLQGQRSRGAARRKCGLMTLLFMNLVRLLPPFLDLETLSTKSSSASPKRMIRPMRIMTIGLSTT